MIGKTIDVSVTSVLQTTAGKMIFGKWDERRGEARPAIAATNNTNANPNVPLTEPKKQAVGAEQPSE
jgi:hypothetical protein